MPGAFKRFLRCNRGNTLVIATAAMPMVIGAGAVGIDVTHWALTKRQLQRSADSAALAGAMALQWERSSINAATRDLLLNNQLSYSTPAVIENAPKVGPFKDDAKAVRVRLTATPSLSFISYFMPGSTEMAAEATARVTPDPEFCMYALEKENVAGITFDGSAALGLDCGIGSNSPASPAISAEGASSIRATSIAAVGRVPKVNNFSASTDLLSYQPPLPDPYKDLPAASTFASSFCKGTITPTLIEKDQKNPLKGDSCHQGMTIKASVTLNPGTYVIHDGNLVIESGAIVKGENVTFVFTGSDPSKIGTVTITSTSTVQLSPPVGNDPLKGIVMYQDRAAPSFTSGNNPVPIVSNITGNSTSKIHGSLYFPQQTILFTGNSGINTNCMRLVARRLRFTGNSSVTNSCSAEQGFGLYGFKARLVG